MDSFESLYFVNSDGVRVDLSIEGKTDAWELIGRRGFSAPPVELITQRYANGVTKLLRRLIEPRTVSISMVVVGNSTEERDAVFFDMIGKLFGSGDGVGRLYAMRSDGLEVYLNCAYSQGLDVFEEYRKFHRFSLDFYASDPYFYRELQSTDIIVPPENKLTLHDGFIVGNYHKIGEYIGEGYGIVNNNSQVTLDPIIQLKGARGSFTVTNEATGKYIKMNNLALVASDTLVINTRQNERGIYIVHADGSKEQAGQYLSWSTIDFDFPILVGENPINFEVGVGSATEYLRFMLAEQYLSA